MQVTSQLGREHDDHAHHDHDHDASCSSCGHDHEHTNIKLGQLALGVIFVVNAFVAEWLLESSSIVDDLSAMIGAIILGYPIILTGVRDLRMGRLSINELVSLAVLASAYAIGVRQGAVPDILGQWTESLSQKFLFGGTAPPS